MELGTGTGAFTLRLLENDYQVVVSGIDPKSFDVKGTSYFFLDLEGDNLIEHHGNYYGVVAIEVIEHLENIFDFFRKVYLLLKPGGLAFITTPNILEVMSRLMFLHSGNFLLVQESYINKWGHIKIILR